MQLPSKLSKYYLRYVPEVLKVITLIVFPPYNL